MMASRTGDVHQKHAILGFTTCIPFLSRRASYFVQPFHSAKCFSRKRCKSSVPVYTAPQLSAVEDPVTKRVRDELAQDGINLDELLNAAKVVNLTRKLDTLTLESQQLAGSSNEYAELQAKITKIERDLLREKRQVMQTWLKRLFLFQSYLFIGLGGLLSTDTLPNISVPLVGQALGFWMIWLFTIPALRARKGIASAEKSALNVAFLSMPFVNLILPALTKNCGAIWAADVVFLGVCYLYYGVRYVQGLENEDSSLKEEGKVRGVLRYLDWGSWR